MMAGWRLDDVITREQILRLISKQRELNFKPGDEYLYCNTGFTLMAEIVSRVTGESFDDWTKKNIFDPLEMKNTLFYDDHEKVVKNRAYSYYKANGGDATEYKKSVLSYANAGATSLFTTVEDLSKWAQNFETIKVGNPGIMAEMNRRFVLNRGDTINYAFGQSITKYKGLKTVSHGGGDAGYRTYLLRFPDQHLSISVFSNFAWFDPGGMSYAIADAMLAGKFKPEGPGAPPLPDPPKKSFDPKSVVLSDFTGSYYSDELETRYTLDIKNDTLTSHHQRHNDFKLTATAPDTFNLNFLGTLAFTRDAKGKVNGFKASNGRVRNLVFRKESL
jgi:CubicO group peptidase (beta-lactamase class C family)